MVCGDFVVCCRFGFSNDAELLVAFFRTLSNESSVLDFEFIGITEFCSRILFGIWVIDMDSLLLLLMLLSSTLDTVVTVVVVVAVAVVFGVECNRGAGC